MPRRPGGLDPAEINEALAALDAATSRDGLAAALDRLPALRTPTLHAILRQQYIELQNTKSPRLANFAPRYQDFFMLLHERWHREIVRAVRSRHQRSGGPAGPPPHGPEPFLPPFWAALRRALGDTVPANQGPLHDSARPLDALEEEVTTLVGHPVELPSYEPTPGARWNAIVVGCAACGLTRLDVRAYIVDLVVAPELAEPLRARRLNNTVCGACGEACSYPVRVWLMDAPGPGDMLATLSCVWRLAPDVFCYQPPPGTPRDEEKDRILEVRFQSLFGRQRWPEPPELAGRTGPVQTTISVAYSVDELVHYLGRATGAGDLPFAMETLVREMTRKVESGVLPLHDAMKAAVENAALVGKDWPVVQPGRAHEWAGPPLAHLFHCLIAEGVLQAREAAGGERAMLALQTVSSLLALGEGALAESALARAQDCLAAAPVGRVRELAALAADDTRADLLEFFGRYDEAAGLREKLRAAPELQRDDPGARIARLGLASQEALGLYKRDRFGDALDAFERCIGDWEALLEEMAAAAGHADAGDVDDRRAATVRGARHALSGDLANLAAVLMALVDDLVVAQIAQMPDLTDDQRRALIVSAHPDPVRAMTRVDEAFPALERMFGDGIDRRRLSAAADGLLRRALELSTAVEGWEFAGVQAHRLALLRQAAGDAGEAETFAAQAVIYAAKAGDHERVWTALAFLAGRALDRGDGPGAIAHLEACARHRIRHEVGLGHHTELLVATEALGDAAFRAVGAGGDPLGAIMIVESLRAGNTAASMVTGTPFQLAGGEIPEAIEGLVGDREQLRMELTWSPDDADARRRLRDVEAALERERHALSLRDPRFSRWADATDVDLATPDGLTRRLAALGPTSVWLGALAVGKAAWTYAAGAGGATVSACALPDLPGLDDSEGVPSGASWTDEMLAAIADAVLTPHAARIAALTCADTLVISVAGPLQYIPFAALPWGGKRLCEYASIVTTQGFGLFEAALDRPALAFDTFALIGAPKRPDLPALPGAAAELDAIAGLLAEAKRDVRVAKGAAARTAALADHAPACDVLHLACHAVADPSPARASQLMLSPDVIRGDSGDVSEDRIVTRIALRSGALVNVAGCATGRTRDTGAPLLGGLVPAFLLAGARSVVASLWPIADAPAARFQLEIYRQLVAGARPAAALAGAQRKGIRGELGDDMRAPAIWAAYAAYGGG